MSEKDNTPLIGKGYFANINFPEVFNEECTRAFFIKGISHMFSSGLFPIYDILGIKGLEFSN